jgi:hypothetical protein
MKCARLRVQRGKEGSLAVGEGEGRVQKRAIPRDTYAQQRLRWVSFGVLYNASRLLSVQGKKGGDFGSRGSGGKKKVIASVQPDEADSMGHQQRRVQKRELGMGKGECKRGVYQGTVTPTGAVTGIQEDVYNRRALCQLRGGGGRGSLWSWGCWRVDWEESGYLGRHTSRKNERRLHGEFLVTFCSSISCRCQERSMFPVLGQRMGTHTIMFAFLKRALLLAGRTLFRRHAKLAC